MIKFGITEKLIIYVLSKKTSVSTKELIVLLKKIKKSESAVRSSLFRLRQKGLISSSKTRRATRFNLTQEGQEWISSFRIKYARSQKSWRGSWLLLTFNIPEKMRPQRNILRDELKGLGFARLHNNLWISPYDLRAECSKTIKEHGLEGFVWMFTTDQIGEDDRHLASRIWGLDHISQLYRELVDTYKKKITEFCKKQYRDEDEAAMEAIMRILELKQDLAEIIEKDPMLPQELMPKNWPGFDLEKVIFEYGQILCRKAAAVAEFSYLANNKIGNKKYQKGIEHNG